MRGAPRTDPGERDYRTGLLPWVLTAGRCWQPAVSAASHVAGSAGSVSGPWFVAANCPWPAPFPRPAPPAVSPGDYGQAFLIAFVRRRPRYYGAVRLPASVHRRLAPLGFTARTLAGSSRGPEAGSPSFRPESLRTCMGSRTARGPAASRASDAVGIAFGTRGRPRRPDSTLLSRLNTQPARTPVNACNLPLRADRHDSGPARVATALPYGSFIHCSPSFTGASAR